MDDNIFNLLLECLTIMLISIGFYCLKRSRCLMNQEQLSDIHQEIISLREFYNGGGLLNNDSSHIFLLGNSHPPSPKSQRARSRSRSHSVQTNNGDNCRESLVNIIIEEENEEECNEQIESLAWEKALFN